MSSNKYPPPEDHAAWAKIISDAEYGELTGINYWPSDMDISCQMLRDSKSHYFSKFSYSDEMVSYLLKTARLGVVIKQGQTFLVAQDEYRNGNVDELFADVWDALNLESHFDTCNIAEGCIFCPKYIDYLDRFGV